MNDGQQFSSCTGYLSFRVNFAVTSSVSKSFSCPTISFRQVRPVNIRLTCLPQAKKAGPSKFLDVHSRPLKRVCSIPSDPILNY